MAKYPKNIMRRCRQILGLEPDDTSRDAEIDTYSKREVFEACCNEEGLINWAYTLLSWLSDIYNEEDEIEWTERIGSVNVHPDTGQIYQDGIEIRSPWFVKDAYNIYSTYEWLRDNYSNDSEELWKLASETREYMSEDEGCLENDAVFIVAKKLNITLKEEM